MEDMDVHAETGRKLDEHPPGRREEGQERQEGGGAGMSGMRARCQYAGHSTSLVL